MCNILGWAWILDEFRIALSTLKQFVIMVWITGNVAESRKRSVAIRSPGSSCLYEPEVDDVVPFRYHFLAIRTNSPLPPYRTLIIRLENRKYRYRSKSGVTKILPRYPRRSQCTRISRLFFCP